MLTFFVSCPLERKLIFSFNALVLTREVIYMTKESVSISNQVGPEGLGRVRDRYSHEDKVYNISTDNGI